VFANEVMAEALQLVHVHPDPFVLKKGTIAQSKSRIAPNYQPPIGPICTYQMNYVNVYVFILANIIFDFFNFVIGRH
jgi:hypothetical protein